MNIPTKALILGIAIVGVGALALLARSLQSSSRPQFVPNPANDKLLISSGWNAAELEKLLRDFQLLYSGRFQPAFTIQSTQVKSTEFRITFPNDIDPILFYFLVNYASYPKDLDLSNRTILIAGRATLDQNFALPNPSLIGQKALIYVPSDDHEFDLVYVKTEQGQVFEDSFASSKWKLVQNPRLPSGIEALK